MTRARGLAFIFVSVVALLGLSPRASAVSGAYPPTGAPGTPVVVAGGTETISFTSLDPDTPYHVVVHSAAIDLGTWTTDASGNLMVSFNTAALEPGQHSVTATSPTGAVTTATFTVVAASPSTLGTASPPAATPSSGLAFTGARVWGLMAAAACLVAFGVAAIWAGRRRRQ